MKKLLLFGVLFLTIVFVNAQNDNCSGAIPLTVGTDFASGVLTSTNLNATTDGSLPACNPYATDNVWFTVVVPASGSLTIRTGWGGSFFYNSVLTVYSGNCSALTEIGCNDDYNSGFSLVSLSGQTPGTTLYVSVWKQDSNTNNGEFQISAYDPIPPANDKCAQATLLTVGTDFASGAIISNNAGAITDGSLPSCNSYAVDNVWFTAVVPQSGNIKIEIQEASGSPFYAPVLTVYRGTCGSLTEINCSNDIFYVPISLTGQIPGTILYISVWRDDDSFSENGEFQISAYDNTALSTHEVSENSKKIRVSPNPFTDILTVSNISEVQSISVVDASGSLVKTIEKPSSSLQLGEVQEGVYLLILKLNDGTTKTIKTIKK
ncbi:T9SS type A sorting domain-containing protein [Chryseobacterium sp. RRHN12]|uniref:T9SS type A sorting domain-containing protein n=1 Tax=Chryseobacterium sp. RRHN12 TaxID=3437884 RepID=UPI003D9BE41A